MQREAYADMARFEGAYWWYIALRRLVSSVICNQLADQASPRILDLGCGTGGGMSAWAKVLPQSYLIGMDIAPEAIQACAGSQVTLFGSANRLPFADDCFDTVVCLDLLYIQGVDDKRAVREIARVLKPRGRVVINVPALAWLRGGHDRLVHTRHRYQLNEVRSLLEAEGFQIKRLQYWNAFSLPVVWLTRRVLNPDRGYHGARLADAKRPRHSRVGEDSPARSDLRALPGWLNRALARIAAWDIELCRVLRLPLGSSVFAEALAPAQPSRRKVLRQPEPAAAGVL